MGEAKTKTVTTNEDRKHNLWDGESMASATKRLNTYEVMWTDTEGTVRSVMFKRGEALHYVKNGLVEAASVAKDKRDFTDSHVDGTYREWYLAHDMDTNEATRTLSFYEAAEGLIQENVISEPTELMPSHGRYLATTMRKDKNPKKAGEAYVAAQVEAEASGSNVTAKSLAATYETLFPSVKRKTAKTEAAKAAAAFDKRTKELNEAMRDADKLPNEVLVLISGGNLTDLAEAIVLLQSSRTSAVAAEAEAKAIATAEAEAEAGKVEESSTIEATG